MWLIQKWLIDKQWTVYLKTEGIIQRGYRDTSDLVFPIFVSLNLSNEPTLVESVDNLVSEHSNDQTEHNTTPEYSLAAAAANAMQTRMKSALTELQLMLNQMINPEGVKSAKGWHDCRFSF